MSKLFKSHNEKMKSSKNYRVIGENNSEDGNRVIKGDISNLLESLKIDILSTFSNSMDQFKLVKNKEEIEKFLFVYYPKCAKRHAQNECLLNKIRICNISQDPHVIDV